MFHNVFLKTIYDKRWAMLGWGLGLCFLAWLVVWFYPTLGKSMDFAKEMSQLPPALQKLAGTAGEMNVNTIEGFLSSQVFQKTMPMMMAVLGVVLGCGALAAEEDRGTLQTLLSAPVSRTKVFAQKWLAMAVVIAVITLLAGIGIYIGLWQLHLGINNVNNVLALANVWLFGVFFMSLAMSLGAMSGSYSITVGLSSLVGVAGYFLTTFAVAIDKLKPFEKFSPYHYYGSQNILTKGLEYKYTLVLAAAVVILMIVGGLVFRKRDISGV